MQSTASPQTSVAKKLASPSTSNNQSCNQKERNNNKLNEEELAESGLFVDATQISEQQRKAASQVQVGHCSIELPCSSPVDQFTTELGRFDRTSGGCCKRDNQISEPATEKPANRQTRQQVQVKVEQQQQQQQRNDSSLGDGREFVALQVESDSDNCSKANKLDQRIKVTLSAPSNSAGARQPEPVLFESGCVIAEQRAADSGPLNAEEADSHIRRASGERRQIDGQEDLKVAASRLERENELRKIAAQRASRLKQQDPQLSTVVSTSSSIAKLNEIQRKTTTTTDSPSNEKLAAKKGAQTRQQVAPPVPPNPQQLAIYINGNIRSNSIFCQSSSLSQSFNNILNRFQQSSSDPSQQESSLKLKIDDKHSPLRLCQNNHHKSCSSKRRFKTGNKSSNISGKLRCPSDSENKCRCEHKSRAPRFIKNLRSSACNLFRDWHLIADEEGQQLADRSQKERLDSRASEHRKAHNSRESRLSNSSLGELDRSPKPSTSSSVSLRGANKLDREKEANRYENEQDCYSGDSSGGSREEQTNNKPNYKLNPSSMFLRKAMRYYRLWIYCTNILILFGALIFILAAIYVTSDYRIKLLVTRSQPSEQSLDEAVELRQQQQQQQDGQVSAAGQEVNHLTTTARTSQAASNEPGVAQREYDIHISFSEPCVIIVYAVIALQAGLLQVFGCIGAIRMKEKWIQAYWYIILALCALDLVFVIYWGYRYKYIMGSLHHHMTVRLNQHYGHFADHSTPITFRPPDSSQENVAFNPSESVLSPSELFATSTVSPLGQVGASDKAQIPHEMRLKLDKILTEIIDRIQVDSQCCGISSSLDYRRSRWRQAKVAQLSLRLNWSQPEERDLLRRVPLVPASCCRRPSQRQASGKPVILDDSQLVKPARVPAWSPSMVVEDLQVNLGAKKRQRGQTKTGQPANGSSGAVATSGQASADGDGDDEDEQDYGDTRASKQAPDPADLLEQRWTGFEEQAEGQLSKQQRRLLSKQEHFNQRRPSFNQEDLETLETAEAQRISKTRRWAVESSVDEQERVLSRIIDTGEHLAAAESGGGEDCNDELNAERALDAELGEGSRIASNKLRLAALRRMLFAMGGDAIEFGRDNFKWPNKVQLSYDQYKVIEEYLLGDENAESADSNWPADDGRSRQKRHNWLLLRPERAKLSREPQETNGRLGGINVESIEAKRLRDKLVGALRADPETSCAARSYYDHATIYTRGCQTAIENWVESSMNVLFVAGVCVLCFVKLCSLFMLRFEIREMIHKIRVLKGMATEYNALQDLEAYLPRPSVCAQAAELTPSGVTAAIPPLAGGCGGGGGGGGGGGSISGQGSGPNPIGLHRLGGSFSEAVAAATAAAAASQTGRTSPTGRLVLDGLAGSGRAASMKAVAAMSCMLTPGLCPRSSSVSAAQLQAASWLSNLSQAGAGNRKLSTSPVVSRRHTAISVCPAAAAAAQHLMSRRGTYVANPAFGQLGALRAPGMNLEQHRHSAHTVNAAQLLLSPQCSSGWTHNKPQVRQYLTGTAQIDRRSIEHQSSAESASLSAQQQRSHMITRSAQANTGSSQLLSLVYPFKRQSSSGAQSACNFSLDIGPPGGLLESRRSIH